MQESFGEFQRDEREGFQAGSYAGDISVNLTWIWTNTAYLALLSPGKEAVELHDLSLSPSRRIRLNSGSYERQCIFDERGERPNPRQV